MQTIIVVSSNVEKSRCDYENKEGEWYFDMEKLRADPLFQGDVFYTLSEFMDELNNEDYPTDSWTTYVYINN